MTKLCKPTVEHELKMFAKKTLRRIHSHNDKWRDLIKQAKKETEDEQR
jgi:hypothetical protein